MVIIDYDKTNNQFSCSCGMSNDNPRPSLLLALRDHLTFSHRTEFYTGKYKVKNV